MISNKDREEICRMIVEMIYEAYVMVPKMVVGSIDRNYLYKKCLKLWGVEEHPKAPEVSK